MTSRKAKEEVHRIERERIVEYVIIACLAVALLITLILYLKPDKVETDTTTTGLNNSTAISQSEIEESTSLTLVPREETQTYNNITTYEFYFCDENGTETKLHDGYIDLTDIISVVNETLSTIKYKVCSVGIVGSTVYFQVDSRYEATDPMQLNIITIKDDITADEWIKTMETVNDTVVIYAENLVSYQNTYGSKHFMYIYSDINNTSVDTTDIIDSVQDIEDVTDTEQGE